MPDPTPSATVRPFLMFQGQAEAAIELYVSLLPDARVEKVERYGPGEQGKEGSFKLATISLAGQKVLCFDSPVPHAFGFTPSFSFFVDVGSGDKFEHLTASLSEGGEFLMPPDDYGFSRRFAWLNDRFGVSWQINLPPAGTEAQGEEAERDAKFERLAPDTLRIERLLDAPIDAVWRWLVDPELRKQWFAGGTTPHAGGEVDLVFDHDNLSADPVPYPAKYAQWKGALARERVLQAEPPHRLVFTWDQEREGLVTFELFAEGERTRLVLTHSGISGPPALANFGGGWLSHLAVLQHKLAGRTVPDFWALHQRFEAVVRAQVM